MPMHAGGHMGAGGMEGGMRFGARPIGPVMGPRMYNRGMYYYGAGGRANPLSTMVFGGIFVVFGGLVAFVSQEIVPIAFASIFVLAGAALVYSGIRMRRNPTKPRQPAQSQEFAQAMAQEEQAKQAQQQMSQAPQPEQPPRNPPGI